MAKEWRDVWWKNKKNEEPLKKGEDFCVNLLSLEVMPLFDYFICLWCSYWIIFVKLAHIWHFYEEIIWYWNNVVTNLVYILNMECLKHNEPTITKILIIINLRRLAQKNNNTERLKHNNP